MEASLFLARARIINGGYERPDPNNPNLVIERTVFHGNILILDPKNIFIGDSLRTSTYMIPTINEFNTTKPIRDLDGHYFPPSNFALLAMTSGAVGSGSAFSGKTDVIDPLHETSYSIKESII